MKLIAIVLLLLMSGCAMVNGIYDAKGVMIGATGGGLFWSIEVEQVHRDGTRTLFKSRSIFTDIAHEAETGVGTAAAVGQVIKP